MVSMRFFNINKTVDNNHMADNRSTDTGHMGNRSTADIASVESIKQCTS